MTRSKVLAPEKTLRNQKPAAAPAPDDPRQPLQIIEHAGQLIVKGWIPLGLEEE